MYSLKTKFLDCFKLLLRNLSIPFYFVSYLLYKKHSLLFSPKWITNGSQSKIAIIATFDSNENLRSDLYEIAVQLQKIGYEIIVVNNSNVSISEKEQFSYFTRKNIGYDLGASRDILRLLNKEVLSNLVVLNDSVDWKSKELVELVSSLELGGDGVWTLVESMQGGRHAQSFFFYVSDKSPNRNIIKIFCQAFEKVRNTNCKRCLIWFGEKSISKYLNSRGIAINFYFTYDFLVERFKASYFAKQKSMDALKVQRLVSLNILVNPSIHLSLTLLDLKAPFLKRSIYLNNVAKFQPQLLAELRKKFNA